MTTIEKLLVANRGEIARRVFRTCRDLGIGTVAIHSDADAGLPHVCGADVAGRLPGSSPADTYLRGDLFVAAAMTAGADAVHPGYGFLSENAAFARQVIEAGLIWIGPAPESIEQMGSKVAAKKLMESAGVPLLTTLDPATAREADLPVLVKASAGGGGRGMRVARSLDALPGEVELASAEALAAFGDGTVCVESYVERGRHVEVQVVGHDGGVLVLGDRDCSVQRRHQKVVEESPAPGLSAEVRTRLHDAARAAADAIDYRGAGTVEFLLDVDGERFYFLEMNTRLQVEHPVTEAVHGVDLVELQVAVAEGRPVGAGTPPDGHAIEVRLYAEDPAHDWQPQSGRLTRFDLPTGPGLRVDSGFEAGDEVSTHYDAMLAKVVAHAPTRDAAARRLAGALERAEIHGVHTNRDLLVRILRSSAFLAGELGTDFLERHDLTSDDADGDRLARSAFAAAVHLASRAPGVQGRVPPGWRNVVSQPQRTEFEETSCEWLPTRAGFVSGPLTAERSERGVAIATSGSDNSVVRTFTVYVDGQRVDVESSLGHVSLTRRPRFVDPADQVASGSLLAPMPGSVVRLLVEPGATVAAGDAVLVL
ncbi:biotin carboxylase N-terminal domain-containing protein [soil metagenome]